MNQALKNGLARVARNLAGVAIVYGTQVGASALMGLNLPPAVAPFVPMVLGPVVNGAAKFGRDLGSDFFGKVCKVF